MAGSSGFSIAIKATDQTAGPLDAINKRLARLSAPAERFNKSLAKFGEVSGINRVSEGFGSLGRTAHDAFMSMDRVSGSLAALTSAGSIAGVVALSQRWADLGSSISRTSFRLSMPVEKLSALQGAGARFGSTADAVSNSLSGLRDTLYGGAFRGEKLSFLHAAGLDQAPGHVMDTMKAFDILADKVAGEKDVHTKLRYITEAGMDPSLLPLMNKGAKGVHEEMQRQADLGGTVTQKMTDDAIKTKQSFDDLGTAIGGVANRLGDELGKQVEGYAERAAKWIGANKDTADSIAKIGGAISGLLAIKPAMWVLRLLGLGGVAGTVGTAATLASPLMLSGDTPSDPLLNQPSTGPGFFGQGGTLENWLRHPFSGAASRGSPGPSVASNARHNPLNLRYVQGQPGASSTSSGFGAYDSDQAGVSAAERQLMLYRGRGITKLGDIIKTWAPPNENNTASYIAKVAADTGWKSDSDIDVSDPTQAGKLIEAMARRETRDVDPAVVGRGVAGGLGRLVDPSAVAGAQAGAASVHVEVTLKGATAGTTAKVTSSGPVSAPPPRIETPMPF